MYITAFLFLVQFPFGSCTFLRRTPSFCQPFHSNFPSSSISDSPTSAPFSAISPPGSYRTGSDGLELYMQKPEGVVTTKGRTNDKVADGATVNSTFGLLYGIVTFEVSAPVVAGVVTAAILIGDRERDEIDIELLGGDPKHWQTNVFAPSAQDPRPHYGNFNTIENIPHGESHPEMQTIETPHFYTVDWSRERIVWRIDGKDVRTLLVGDTMIDGIEHYPSHFARVQLGIWDASNPAGTSAWAKGPIDWNKAPPRITAVIRSVAVECPYS